MSSEEDFELRDLVSQTLETNGCLSKIRAQLRASIFLALDEDEEMQKRTPLINTKLKTHLQSREGQIMFCLVREFLEYFDLDFTISVFEPESYLGNRYIYGGRDKTIEDLGVPLINGKSEGPLLLKLLDIAKMSIRNIDINLNAVQNSNYNSDSESSDSKQKTDGTGEIIGTDIESESGDPFSTAKQVPNLILPQREGIIEKDTLNSTFDVYSPVYEPFRKNKNVESDLLPVKQNEGNTLPNSVANDEPKVTEPSSFDIKSPERSRIDSVVEQSSKSSEAISSSDTNSSEKSPLDLKAVQQQIKICKDQSVSDNEFSPPLVGKSQPRFDPSPEKLKISPPKTDKLKAKSSLSSLADLPPLPLNKTRTETVLLPSLYSKEFKEKSNLNLKEIDKFLDDSNSLDNYEEDFMSSSEADTSKSNVDLASHRLNLFEELQQSGNAGCESNKSASPRGKDSKSVVSLRKSTASQSSGKCNPVRSESTLEKNSSGKQSLQGCVEDGKDVSTESEVSKLDSSASTVTSEDFENSNSSTTEDV